MDPETQNPNSSAPSSQPSPQPSPPPAAGPSWSMPANNGGPVPNPQTNAASQPTAPAPTSSVEQPVYQPQPDPVASNNTLQTVATGFKAVLGAIFSWIVFPIAVVLILHNFVFQAYHVVGTSMFPTLHDADYLIISKLGSTETMLGHFFGQNGQYIPARGQIIVFHYPQNPTEIFVKRVVGLPGDRVVVKNGTVTVYNKANPNGFNPDTTYEPKDTVTLLDQDEVVQDGNVFVMGDNRTPGGSFDSRSWGQLPSSYIIGNAVLRLLPLDQVKIL